jgi:hypothetical protein
MNKMKAQTDAEEARKDAAYDKCGFRGKAGAIPELIRSAFRN